MTLCQQFPIFLSRHVLLLATFDIVYPNPQKRSISRSFVPVLSTGNVPSAVVPPAGKLARGTTDAARVLGKNGRRRGEKKSGAAHGARSAGKQAGMNGHCSVSYRITSEDRWLP